MKITAKLALSQVWLNRQRTIGAVCAIALSTALMTAVSCFVSSGNAMLIGFLGEGYGEYGGTYRMVLLIPALIFGLLIFFMSVTVISNVFRSSANQRIKQFGIIKCVGATTKQVKQTVIYESIWLSMIGIPIGIILGIILGFWGVQITSGFVDDMNILQQSIIMRPVSFSLSFVVTPLTYIVSALFSFLTVLYSAYKPAKKAGRVTALSCIRGLGEIKVEEAFVRERSFIKKILGFEGVLADRTLSRNKHSYKATIRSLALGIMLILSTGSLAIQATKVQEFMDPGTEDVMVDYCSSRERITNQRTGRQEEIYHKPIHSAYAEEVTAKLLEYGDIEILGVGTDNGTYYSLLESKYFTADMIEGMELDPNEQSEIAVDIVVFDQKNYEKLCSLAAIPVGGTILLNYYKYNDNGHLREIVPYTEELKELNIYKANGEATSLSVDGFLQKEFIPKQAIGLSDNALRLVVPEAELRYFDWFTQPEDENDYMAYAKSVTDTFFPTYTDDSYAKEGFTVRISRTDTMVKVLNIAVVMAEVVLYGFVTLLLSIGLASVISTLSTNILTRAREFAVLKSIGMTTEGLRKMLLSESLLCTMKATIQGIPLGILIPYSINLAIRKIFPVRYELPWSLLIWSILGIMGLIMLITLCAIYKLKKQNLIEAIRMETM